MPVFIKRRLRRFGRRKRGASLAALVLLVSFCAFVMVPAARYMGKLSAEMALSDASDIITLAVNRIVRGKMEEGEYDYEYFASLDRDEAGRVTAVTANMSRMNMLAAEILQEIVQASDNEYLDIEIPLGNLLGSNLLLGRGPKIPVRITVLTSSYTDFRSELTEAGINQSRHQIILETTVDIDIVIPWNTLSTQVENDVIIAETIIVGEVPDTFVKVE